MHCNHVFPLIWRSGRPSRSGQWINWQINSHDSWWKWYFFCFYSLCLSGCCATFGSFVIVGTHVYDCCVYAMNKTFALRIIVCYSVIAIRNNSFQLFFSLRSFIPLKELNDFESTTRREHKWYDQNKFDWLHGLLSEREKGTWQISIFWTQSASKTSLIEVVVPQHVSPQSNSQTECQLSRHKQWTAIQLKRRKNSAAQLSKKMVLLIVATQALI